MLGLDQPLYVQYGTWLWKRCILTLVSHSPANARCWTICELPARHAGTCRCRAGVNSAPSVPLGIWAARHRDRLPDFAYVSSRFSACRCPTSGWRFCCDGVFGISAMATRDGLRRLADIILPAVSIAFMSLAINARLCAPVCWTSPVSVTSPGRGYAPE